MKTSVLIWNFIAFTLFGFSNFCLGQTNSKQDFETEFNIANYPDEFLSGWSANQIRSGKSRVFQASAEGIADSQALAIQTTSTFNAQIYIKTLTVGLKSPQFHFGPKQVKMAPETDQYLYTFLILQTRGRIFQLGTK